MPGSGSGVHHHDVGPELVEFFVADAFHLAKVFNFREKAVRGPMLNHPLGQLRANARQRFQIGSGRMI